MQSLCGACGAFARAGAALLLQPLPHFAHLFFAQQPNIVLAEFLSYSHVSAQRAHVQPPHRQTSAVVVATQWLSCSPTPTHTPSARGLCTCHRHQRLYAANCRVQNTTRTPKTLDFKFEQCSFARRQRCPRRQWPGRRQDGHPLVSAHH